MRKAEPFPPRSRRLSFLVVLAVLALKLLVLRDLNDHPLLQPTGDLDPACYVDLARQVASGHDAPAGQSFFVSPLYVYFLALVFSLTGGSLLAAKIVQVVLGAAAVWLISRTAAEWFGERAAWIAAALAGLCGVFTFYEVLLLQAALDPFLTALDLYVVTRALRAAHGAPRTVWWWSAGACLGLHVLNRPNVLAYVVPAMLALALVELRGATRRDGSVAWKRAVLAAACCAFGLALVVGPVAWRNYRACGDVVLVSSHGGLNFYIGNHAGADGTFTRIPGITPSIAGQAEDAARVVERALGHKPGPSEVSNYFAGQAWNWIRDEPAAAAALFLRKILYVFNAGWLTLNYSYPYYQREASAVLSFLFIGPWLLLPLGLVGLFVRGRQFSATDEAEAAGAARAGMAPFDLAYLGWAAFVPVYAVSVAAFFVSARYRMPLLVPLAVTAAAAIDAGTRALSRRELHRLSALAGLVSIVALATNWPLHLDDGMSAERTKMIRYLIGAGEHQAAAELLERTQAGHPHPAVLFFAVGQEYLNRQDAARALPLLERALQLEPDRAETRLSLAQALMQAQRPAEAAAYFRDALEKGYAMDVALPQLVRVLAQAGQRDAAVATLREASHDERLKASTRVVAGGLAIEMQEPGVAVSLLEKATAQEPDNARAQEALGLALAMMGRAGDAVAPLQTACGLDAGNAQTRLNLAVVYANMGRFNEARRAAGEALGLQPDYARARELLQALPR